MQIPESLHLYNLLTTYVSVLKMFVVERDSYHEPV